MNVLIEQVMDESRQTELENSFPELRIDLFCRHCDEAGFRFTWQKCPHYGCGEKRLWGGWIRKLGEISNSIPGETEFYGKVLREFREDTVVDQIDYAKLVMNSESPELILCTSRHAWPVDDELKDRKKVRGVQIYPFFVEIGSYDLLYHHSLQVLDIIHEQLSEYNDLNVIIYMGSNATPQFAFNDALQQWLNRNNHVSWTFWNMFYDIGYLGDSQKTDAYHMRPNCSFWRM